nr:MAG TPA: hypothetical protein [Caudoviricetes sp.]
MNFPQDSAEKPQTCPAYTTGTRRAPTLVGRGSSSSSFTRPTG